MATSILEVKGIGPATAKTLSEHNINSAEELATAKLGTIMAIPGFSEIRAGKAIAEAKKAGSKTTLAPAPEKAPTKKAAPAKNKKPKKDKKEKPKKSAKDKKDKKAKTDKGKKKVDKKSAKKKEAKKKDVKKKKTTKKSSPKKK